jgi:hypothetical protein
VEPQKTLAGTIPDNACRAQDNADARNGTPRADRIRRVSATKHLSGDRATLHGAGRQEQTGDPNEYALSASAHCIMAVNTATWWLKFNQIVVDFTKETAGGSVEMPLLVSPLLVAASTTSRKGDRDGRYCLKSSTEPTRSFFDFLPEF